MPYINAKVSVSLTKEKENELKAALGRAIGTIPGKSETYLMVCIEADQHIWLAGRNDTPKAFVDVRILGHAKAEDYDRMTGVVCAELEKLLGIAQSDTYVMYSETDNWGWNGRNF